MTAGTPAVSLYCFKILFIYAGILGTISIERFFDIIVRKFKCQIAFIVEIMSKMEKNRDIFKF
ncbi:hypothetical protein AS29_001315 [Bacillus sp. SJS]|nr:hypothetical protein AS29_001315 [Bacillus sp. SJS]